MISGTKQHGSRRIRPGARQCSQMRSAPSCAKPATNPAQEAAAKSRHLNVWVSADDALFSIRNWREGTRAGLCLDDFEGQPCHLGLDLASRTDLAALVMVFPRKDGDGRTIYTTFARCYLNEAAVMEARNPSYPGWANDGYLTITAGNETDFSVIEADILDLCRRFRVASVAYDPWAATQLAQRPGRGKCANG